MDMKEKQEEIIKELFLELDDTLNPMNLHDIVKNLSNSLRIK